MIGRRLLILAGLTALTALLCVASLSAGRIWVPPAVWFDGRDPRSVIILGLRAPRTILAVLVGGALGLSGAAMQGYTRNPLADPGALGVSSVAALGAVLTLYLGAGGQATWVVSAAAMAGALGAVVLLLALAGRGSTMVTFVLAGVVLQTLAAAGVALALSLAPNPWAVDEIVNWLMGSLADRGMEEVWFATPPVLVGLALLLTLGPALDALTLGDGTARSLGVDLGRARLVLALGTALAVGASVAVTGVVSFVGLIVPHVLRPFVGARPGALLLPSALGGAVLVLAADILVRIAPGSTEVKLGVAMAALGAPFFFALILTLRRRAA